MASIWNVFFFKYIPLTWWKTYIGLSTYIGSNTANIAAYDQFGGLTDYQNVWMYYPFSQTAWMTSAPNDTSVRCCQTVIVMCGSCHIGNVLIGVEYRKLLSNFGCLFTFSFFLIGHILSKLIYLFFTYVLTSLKVTSL